MNRLVASNFMLESASSPGYFLHRHTSLLRALEVGNQMMISTSPDQSGDFNFSLWEVPGTANGAKRYIIGHHSQPASVIEVTANLFPHVLPRYNWKVAQKPLPETFIMEPTLAPDYVFWAVCKTNGHARLGLTNKWMYASAVSWLVYAWDMSGWFPSSPGGQAEWITHPPLMDALDWCP
eukprot:UN0007